MKGSNPRKPDNKSAIETLKIGLKHQNAALER
jgi:hypothetical protein